MPVRIDPSTDYRGEWIFLRDARDHFPQVTSFSLDRRDISFLCGIAGHQQEPLRIRTNRSHEIQAHSTSPALNIDSSTSANCPQVAELSETVFEVFAEMKNSCGSITANCSG